MKVLIANRGEIAIRIIRACRELGLPTVAVYSEADADAWHVELADTAVAIGPAPAARSYLNQEAILAAAARTGADAVHPGYGFLSENPDFVHAVTAAGLTFIGPPAAVVQTMGRKDAARAAAASAGLPVIPGSGGTFASADEALAVAEQIGYPVLLKAAGGGGGRGIRAAHNAEELRQVFDSAQDEATAAFGAGALYLEKFIPRARHIEVQVLADHHGNVIHLGERECSLQRRRQKVLEEAPCPALNPEQRRQMCQAAVDLARSVGYASAGTVEFLFDESAGRFYFLEMNTRLQVEHPVTEMLTGVDIVAEQLRIAAGQPLSLAQDAVRSSGHAIECRINAEDPDRRLFPSTGVITALQVPHGPWMRLDHMARTGMKVAPYYDSLLGKLVVWGTSRTEAIRRMQRCLAEFSVTGIKTTAPLHQEVLAAADFQAGRVHTEWLESFLGL